MLEKLREFKESSSEESAMRQLQEENQKLRGDLDSEVNRMHNQIEGSIAEV